MSTLHDASPPRRVVRRRWLFGAQLALGAGLLAGLVVLFDPAATWRVLREANPWWLALTVGWGFAIQFLRAALLCWIARGRFRLSLQASFRYNLIGIFFSNFTPSQVGGDVVKAAYLWPHAETGAEATATVLLQRIFGFAATALIAAALGARLLPPRLTVGVWAAILAAFGLFFVLWRRLRAPVSDESQVNRLRQPWRASAKLLRSLLLYRAQKGKLVQLAGLSLLSSGFALLVYWPAARAVTDVMSLPQIVFAAGLALLFGIAPFTPGALGVSEGAFVGAATLAGAPPEVATAVALIARAALLVIGLAGGVLHLADPLPMDDIRRRYRRTSGE